MLAAFRLAKAGWWEGDPEKVLQAPVEMVIGAIQYDAYVTEYEAAYLELNREKT